MLVVVHGGEKRTGSLVPGKPDEVYSDAVITVVCSLSLRALAKRWRVRALDYLGGLWTVLLDLDKGGLFWSGGGRG